MGVRATKMLLAFLKELPLKNVNLLKQKDGWLASTEGSSEAATGVGGAQRLNSHKGLIGACSLFIPEIYKYYKSAVTLPRNTKKLRLTDL